VLYTRVRNRHKQRRRPTAYITRCLQVTDQAIDRGIDVRACFHWTGVDNYQWLHGFNAPYGLIGHDRTPSPELSYTPGSGDSPPDQRKPLK
jgi:beta-glucosidase/6-phospho-beta-glucosidase/beta-galactosidase